jgi:hypothetical protein
MHENTTTYQSRLLVVLTQQQLATDLSKLDRFIK